MSDKRECPICHSDPSDAETYLEGNVDEAKLTSFSYASRKTPEFMRLDLVRCRTCDLVFAPQPPTRSELASAYHEAAYDSAEEADDAARAYIEAIRPTLAALPSRRSALEIGTGTGVFLDHLARHGFDELVGIEPSTSAIAAAPPERRAWIREGVFEEQTFAPDSFDLVCCFMTMEHVRDPLEVAVRALDALRPGGAFVTVTHDRRSIVNRVLGRRSPIIDIEHMQLFSPQSIQGLFAAAGFDRVTSSGFRNRYPVQYWWRLAPMPSTVKQPLGNVLQSGRIGSRKLSINVGNTMAAGFKPLGRR